MFPYILAMVVMIIPMFVKTKNINIRASSRSISLYDISQQSVFLMLLCLLAFRGDFATDYSYISSRFYEINTYSWEEIISFSKGYEVGYLALNKIVGSIWLDYRFFFFVTSLISLLPIFFLFKNESEEAWLCCLLFFTIGGFLSTMNVVRQAMAAAVLSMGYKYLRDKKLISYMLIVMLASSMHISCVIFAPLYFLFLGKPNKRYLLAYGVLTLVVLLWNENIIRVFDDLLFGGKYLGFYSKNNYGIALIGTNFLSVFMQLVAFAIVIVNRKLFFEEEDAKARVVFNGAMLWGIFTVLSMVVSIASRFALLCSPYMCLSLTHIVKTNKVIGKWRPFYIMVMAILLCAYFIVFYANSGYVPYYTYFNS